MRDGLSKRMNKRFNYILCTKGIIRRFTNLTTTWTPEGPGNDTLAGIHVCRSRLYHWAAAALVNKKYDFYLCEVTANMRCCDRMPFTSLHHPTRSPKPKPIIPAMPLGISYIVYKGRFYDFRDSFPRS